MVQHTAGSARVCQFCRMLSCRTLHYMFTHFSLKKKCKDEQSRPQSYRYTVGFRVSTIREFSVSSPYAWICLTDRLTAARIKHNSKLGLKYSQGRMKTCEGSGGQEDSKTDTAQTDKRNVWQIRGPPCFARRLLLCKAFQVRQTQPGFRSRKAPVGPILIYECEMCWASSSRN